MKIGKISESILDRSVFKIIKDKSKKVSAAVTPDCAYFGIADAQDADSEGTAENSGKYVLTSVASEAEVYTDSYYYAVYKASNNIYAGGGKPVSLSLSIFMDEKSEESVLKDIIKQVKRAAEELDVAIAGGHTEVTKSVNKPVVSIHMTGISENKPEIRKASPGDSIIMTKYAAVLGTAILAENCREKLKMRLSDHFINEAAVLKKDISIKNDVEVGRESGAYDFHDVSSGGVFAALWELSKMSGRGIDVDLKKIPIKQETVEVTNYIGINPYILTSAGSVLMLTDKPEELIREFEKADIEATVIGTVTDNNDKIIRNDDEVRYLDKPQIDEIHKIFMVE